MYPKTRLPKDSLLLMAIMGLFFFAGCCFSCDRTAQKCDEFGHGEYVEYTCLCDPGYEGFYCESAINAKFMGDYSVFDDCGDSTYTYNARILVSNTDLYLFQISGLARQTVSLTARVDSLQLDRFTISRQPFGPGMEIVSNLGYIDAETDEISIEYLMIQTSTGDTIETCSAILSK